MRRLQRRLKKLWRNSQTKSWSYLQLGSAAILEGMHHVNKVITDPTFHGYLDQLDLPKTIIYGMAIFGMVTFLAHGHDD